MRTQSRSPAILILALSIAVDAVAEKACVRTDQAVAQIDRDVCITAHVYDVVQLNDGTRFLDVCAPSTQDANCHFTIISYWDDHDLVGELTKFRDKDVEIRGIVKPMHGRAAIVLSHARQFYGGPPRFRPNPLLARGFTADQDKPPIHDPNLRAQGGKRSFMNTRDQEALPHK